MINLILLSALNCPKIIMENRTDKAWNDFDNQHLAIAKKRCGEIYRKSPCVKLFRKRSESDYSVICGKEK